jgi:hypothetical protein
MNNKLRTAWTVAAVLAVLLIIMSGLYAKERGLFTLDARDLERQRDDIAKACGSADELDTPACRDALDDLARLLGRFEKKLDRDQKAEGNASTTVEVTP